VGGNFLFDLHRVFDRFPNALLTQIFPTVARLVRGEK
jgi:hypothetical protein